MALDTLQNFYKTVTAQAWGTGTGTFYVSTLPSPSSGKLVINPSNASKREVIKYTSKGTDGTGNYIYVSERGVGDTSDVTHEQNEPVRMNFTAEHYADIQTELTAINDELDAAILAGAGHASTTNEGITKMSVAPASATEPIAVGDNDPRVPTAAQVGYIPTSGQKDALAGGGNFGTPSTSNKFLTEDYIDFIPVTGLVSSYTTNTTVVSSATETTVHTKTIAANFLDINDGLCIEVWGNMTVDGVNDEPTLTIKFDSTSIAALPDWVSLSGAADAAAVDFYAKVYIVNNGSTSSQKVYGNMIGVSGGTSKSFMGAPTDIISSFVDTTASFATAAGFDINITMKNEAASAGESFVFRAAHITKLKAL